MQRCPCPDLPQLLLDHTRQAVPYTGGRGMIPINFDGKVALVTGVGDNQSFAWFIAKALQAAGARLVLGVHPRMIRIVEGFLAGDAPDDVASRVLPFGAGNLKVDKVYPCDVSFDTLADVPEATRTDRRCTQEGRRSARRLFDRGPHQGGRRVASRRRHLDPQHCL